MASVVVLLDHAARRLGGRLAQPFAGGPQPGDRNAGLPQQRLPLVGVAGGEQADQFRPPRGGRLRIGAQGSPVHRAVLDPGLVAADPGQAHQVAVDAAGEAHDLVVARPVEPRREDAAPHGSLLLHPGGEDPAALKQRVGERDLDALTQSAVALAGDQRGAGGQRGHPGREAGRQRERREVRHLPGRAAEDRRAGLARVGPARGHDDALPAGHPGALVKLGEPGQRAVDQPAVEVVAGGGVQAEAGHDPRPEVLDQHIRPGHQRERPGLPLRRLEVEHVRRGPAAQQVGVARVGEPRAAGRLDPGHLRARVGQQGRGHRPGHVLAEVQHPHAVKRPTGTLGGHNAPVPHELGLARSPPATAAPRRSCAPAGSGPRPGSAAIA